MQKSPKLGFLNRGQSDDNQEYFDNLIRVERGEYSPNPVGIQVHLSLARTRIMRGGYGSGKSRCSSEHVNTLALRYPGSLHFVGRKDITSLKVTTQREFLEKVVAPETVLTFNVNENTLYYKNGSIVLFRETKEPAKVKSLELTSYLLDECDENPTNEIWDRLDDRLRQKIWIDGAWVTPPYAGLLVFNPTHDEHWLYELAQRKDIDVGDFRFDTEDNAPNLPPDYIQNLRKKLPPWDIDRMIHGHWGRAISGKPVYHGFTETDNVRYLKVREDLPLLRGWDFGHGHPACVWAQFDPISGRYTRLREFMGKQMKLFQVVPEVKRITEELIGASAFPIFDYGDPHGADEKDTGLPSIEYLRVHHQIHVNYRREKIITGMNEIQEKIVSRAKITESELRSIHGSDLTKEESLFLVDKSCRVSIAAFMGGYHRDELGVPVKDGYYDHLPDCDRYVIVHNMNRHLASRFKKRRPYVPRNLYTGY